jgi:hypothetical protein
MRTHVEFRPAKFPAYPGEEEKVNSGIWGQRLAEYLYDNLAKQGLSVDDIHAEDWGWIIRLCDMPFPTWIGCGNYQEHPDRFLCFIEPSKPTIWRFPFRKINTTSEVTRVADILNNILTSDPDINDIRWWSENEK